MLQIVELEAGNVPVAQAVVDRMRALGAEKHPVLTELRRDVFRGGRTWVLCKDGNPVSMHCSRIGKRRKNIWEPFMNWYGAYTLPDERRRGHARKLYLAVEAEAVKDGCRRVRSLAGSRAGLYLHINLGHQLWGLTQNNEVWVDSPLPGHHTLYDGLTPPQVPQEAQMTDEQLALVMNLGLRYDK